ncbi:NUDIX hydrolase [bacterium]|nr:NUDIX hydrolase [bacterium]
MKEKTPFAAFILAPASTNPMEYAATTRAADRGESGKIGLPGGKVDPRESGEDAVRRESMEEG